MKQYKKAYSTLFRVPVTIDHAWQDDRGGWIFECHSNDPMPGFAHNYRLNNHLFRETELKDFDI